MKETERHGLVLVNKPSGVSSHAVVQQARKLFNTSKIGHAGTLDPFATGLLLLLVGEVVSLQQHFTKFDKKYQSVFKWGKTTDTLDSTGKVIEQSNTFITPNRKKIEQCIHEQFLGNITQIPPLYSAIKIKGQRAYKIARQSDTANLNYNLPEIPKRTVVIHQFDVLSILDDEIEVCISCGSGTYIRSIARDLAVSLGTLGYVETLVRNQIGSYHLNDSLQLENFFENDDLYTSIREKSFGKLHQVYPGIIPIEKIVNQEKFLKGIRLNCSIIELQKSKNGNFNFSLLKKHNGIIQLAYKNQVLMIIDKKKEQVKSILNLLKYIEFLVFVFSLYP